MKYEYISVSRDGSVTTITIERPDSRNALNALANVELADAFDAFSRDDEQWIAILTGRGDKAFCAGHDLKQQASGGGFVIPPSGFAGLTSRFDLAKPVIAAVNGAALGGGFEIALCCDLIVAAQGATFALPEPRFGLAALAGGAQRLPREIGLKRAMAILLTGRVVDAKEGLELGFVNEVVDGDVVAAARRWADAILQCSPMSIRATKESVLAALDVPFEEALRTVHELPAVRSMIASSDLVEGPRAFAERRAPRWSGH